MPTHTHTPPPHTYTFTNCPPTPHTHTTYAHPQHTQNHTEDEDVPDYQLPFQDLVGERATLEMFKDIVVTSKIRPSLATSWRNHQVTYDTLE